MERARQYWKQDVRPVDKIHLVAEYYGFIDDWTRWVSENSSVTRVNLCHQMMVMKATHARRGGGILALEGSPLEGLHRTILAICQCLCTTPSTFGAYMNPPMHLTWDDFVKAGCMHPFNDDVDEVPNIIEIMEKCIWNNNLDRITIGTMYFNTPATKVSTDDLLGICRMRSREISEAKTGSVRQQVFHSLFTYGLEDFTRMMSDKDLVLEPILPDIAKYRIDSYNDTMKPNEAKKYNESIGQMTDQKTAEDVVIGVAPVLYSPVTRAYMDDPLDNEKLQAMREQFTVEVNIDSTRSVMTMPPFMYSKTSIMKSPRRIMSPEHVNFAIMIPRLVALYHKHEGFGGSRDYRENAMVKELTYYLMRHWVALDNDGYRRCKTHGIIGYRYPLHLGTGHHLVGARSFIGAFTVIAQLFNMNFYKQTNAVFPYQIHESTNLLMIDRDSNDLTHIKKNFQDNLMYMSQAFGRHENVNPHIPVLDVMMQLSESLCSIPNTFHIHMINSHCVGIYNTYVIRYIDVDWN